MSEGVFDTLKFLFPSITVADAVAYGAGAYGTDVVGVRVGGAPRFAESAVHRGKHIQIEFLFQEHLKTFRFFSAICGCIKGTKWERAVPVGAFTVHSVVVEGSILRGEACAHKNT